MLFIFHLFKSTLSHSSIFLSSSFLIFHLIDHFLQSPFLIGTIVTALISDPDPLGSVTFPLPEYAIVRYEFGSGSGSGPDPSYSSEYSHVRIFSAFWSPVKCFKIFCIHDKFISVPVM